MKRNCRIWARLSPEELESLNQKAKSTGLSREEYIRKVLAGAVPKQAPPLEYAELLRELRRIGVNLNQIAKQANRSGYIDRERYWKEVWELRQVEKRFSVG